MRFVTQPLLGDASDDAATSTGALTPETVTSAVPSTISKGELFAVSIASGVAVWGITRILSSLFGEKK